MSLQSDRTSDRGMRWIEPIHTMFPLLPRIRLVFSPPLSTLPSPSRRRGGGGIIFFGPPYDNKGILGRMLGAAALKTPHPSPAYAHGVCMATERREHHSRMCMVLSLMLYHFFALQGGTNVCCVLFFLPIAFARAEKALTPFFFLPSHAYPIIYPISSFPLPCTPTPVHAFP